MRRILKAFVKKCLGVLLGEYSAYYIYSTSTEAASPDGPGKSGPMRVEAVESSAIARSRDSLIQEQLDYGGPGSHAFACFADDRIVGICFYWFGDRYRTRNYWPLAEGEAKLVQIISIPEMRGRGVASQLIAASWQEMRLRGFRRSYARVWHSNVPSFRAFERAGWTRIALVIEINPLRRKRPVRVVMNSRGAGRRRDSL